jgi:hypothetical protein
MSSALCVPNAGLGIGLKRPRYRLFPYRLLLLYCMITRYFGQMLAVGYCMMGRFTGRHDHQGDYL